MIRILIVDDQNFARQSVRYILEKQSDFEVIGQAENGIKALEKIVESNPDVAVVDLEMPEMNGFDLTQKIEQEFSHTKVVILSSYDDFNSINSALKAGAKSYLLKSTLESELTGIIRDVYQGYFKLGLGLFEILLAGFIQENKNLTENLSELENKYQDHFNRLEKSIINKSKQTKVEMFQELNIQVQKLKNEFYQGLSDYQNQVSIQIKQGLESVSNFVNTKTMNEHIQTQNFTKTKRAINDLEKQFVIVRWVIIFLVIEFFVETILKFV